jgi:hypothetical protein
MQIFEQVSGVDHQTKKMYHFLALSFPVLFLLDLLFFSFSKQDSDWTVLYDSK